MPLYNFALTPINTAVSKEFTEIAQLHFKGIDDKYLLGEHALPHITLAHFTAEDNEAALKAYKSFRAKQQMMLEVTEYKTNLSQTGNLWAAYFIKKDPTLMALQKEVYAFLDGQSLAPAQQPDTYTPHITLARLTKEPDTFPSLEELPSPYSYKFRMSLGESTDIGVYIKHLAQ